MKKKYPTVIAGLSRKLTIGFILCFTFNALAQSNSINTDSISAKPKTKKQIYIDNYIANFPYKNSDIYGVIKQRNLWDTTGVVPVINANTISINRCINKTELLNEKPIK